MNEELLRRLIYDELIKKHGNKQIVENQVWYDDDGILQTELLIIGTLKELLEEELNDKP